MIQILNIVIGTKKEISDITERIFFTELSKKQNRIKILAAEKIQIKNSRNKWKQKYFNLKNNIGNE